MALDYTSGTPPIGPKSTTVSINSVTYIIEEITITLPGEIRARTDGDGKATEQWGVSGVATGTALLQLATGTTAIPSRWQTFTYDYGTSTSWVITEVEAPATKLEDRKVRISFNAVIA